MLFKLTLTPAIPVKWLLEVVNSSAGTCGVIGSKSRSLLLICRPWADMTLTCHSRYNLKRRVASLPPLSFEYFTEKVLTAQATSSAAAAKASFEKSCSACQKTYYSENAYQNHLKSQKHRLRVKTSQSGNGALQDDAVSLKSSSTFTLGEPIDVAPENSADADAEPLTSDLADSLKDSALTDPISTSHLTQHPHRPAIQNGAVQENQTQIPQKDAVPVVSDSATERFEVPLNHCMFCNYEAPTFDAGVLHMNKFHGMFIPEQQYLVDLEGLIRYLYAKIKRNHECLYCHKLKSTMSSIQTHMRDKGHCMIAFETEEEMIEVGQFYDFSSTYSDNEEEIIIDEMEHTNRETAGGVNQSITQAKALKTVISTSDGDEEMQDGKADNEGWETDSSASLPTSEELSTVPTDRTHADERLRLHPHHSHSDSRTHRAALVSDYELYLPSGRTAGHRSLARYFRQNLHSYPTPTERMENRLIEASSPAPSGDSRGREIISRADGGLGMLGITEAKRQEARATEKRERKREQRAQNQYQWGVDKRGNNQKHFRDPLLQ